MYFVNPTPSSIGQVLSDLEGEVYAEAYIIATRPTPNECLSIAKESRVRKQILGWSDLELNYRGGLD